MINRPDTRSQRIKRHKRVRAKISGTPERPRLNVFRSETNIYAQIIDDVTGKTLVSASSLEKDFSCEGTKTDAAKQVGVTEGYKKELDVNGVGYRVAKEGNKLVMNLGYSHQVTVEEIPGIEIEVPGPNKIIIHGCDKQQVGQFAAEVREKRPPEPYKGKGIKYTDEVIRRKEGKTGVKKK